MAGHNLKELMDEFDNFERIEGDFPLLWLYQSSTQEIIVAMLSDGEIHVTRSMGYDSQVNVIVRFNQFDPGIGPLLHSWTEVLT